MAELTKAELQEALDKANARIAELESADTGSLQKQLDEANEVIAELNSENSKLLLQKSLKTDLPIVKLGDKNYTFTAARFNIPGRGILAASDLGDNDKALEELLGIEGQGILVEIVNNEDVDA
jgi:hypothetical protein